MATQLIHNYLESYIFTCHVHSPCTLPALFDTSIVFKLASLREVRFLYNLPFPIARIILVSASLISRKLQIPSVTLLSLIAYSINNQVLYQEIQLIATVRKIDTPRILSPMAGRGFNTFHGIDTGPPPPNIQQQPYQYGMGYAQQPLYPGTAMMPPTGSAYNQPYQMYPTGPFSSFQQYYQSSNFVYPAPGAHPAWPQPQNSDFPGTSFRNPSGGVGLPPGYDYLFSAEHTVLHCFKPTTQTPPWQTNYNPYDHSKFCKMFAPTNMTVGELIGKLGLNNKDAKKNIIHEVIEKGNGAWAKGLSINGSDKDRCKKKLADFGWDGKRTGIPGQRPVVWLWLQRA